MTDIETDTSRAVQFLVFLVIYNSEHRLPSTSIPVFKTNNQLVKRSTDHTHSRAHGLTFA